VRGLRSNQSRSSYRASYLARWDASFEGSTGLWQRISPPQLLVSSFLLLIGIGTLGLLFLPGIYVEGGLSPTDAIFTATSAVCVTGLIVVDTATYFTPVGQAFLLLLIQLGGLGMLAFTSLIVQILGFRLSLRSESLTHNARQGSPLVNLRRLTRDIVLFTFLIEASGAIALYLVWSPRLGWYEAWWPAVFHAVSGFCNAGFSTNSDSLMSWQGSSVTLGIISVLVVAGGLGFVTMEETWLYLRNRKRPEFTRLSLNSRLILLSTLLLIVIPWPFFAAFEWNRELSGLSIGDRLTNALFLSITPRTAGFNSLDYERASDGTNFLTMLLMGVGGAPGSTAGGMKVTTFALILLLAFSRFRGLETTVFANRSIPQDTIQRAIGLAVLSSAVMAMGGFALIVSQPTAPGESHFLPRIFEVVSAFNTVGLSLNETPKLSLTGRWMIIVLMFLGRVGPMTLAAALVVEKARRSHYRYAYEDIAVG
jgi:trk system potassium uptake protein TrkH